MRAVSTRATVWRKTSMEMLGKGVTRRSGHLRLAFRGMANPSRKRHHKNRQAWKNAECTKVGMAEFELWLNVDNYT